MASTRQKTVAKDILFFGIPAIVVFFFGLVLSSKDGYDGLLGKVWALIKQSESIGQLSFWNIAGLFVFAFGLSIAIVAVGTLKQFYSSTLITRENHRLITHGIYKIVRHPIYFGVLIAVMGPPVYAPSLFGFLVMLLLVPIFLLRIHMEEKMLTERFPDEYETYRASTRKLIPFVY